MQSHAVTDAAGAASVPPVAASEPWQEIVKRWQQPSLWRALWQLVATLTCYVGLWVGIWLSRDVSWWLTMPLAVLAGVLLVRLFILFHDCGHGSFFKSRLANVLVGRVLGVLAWTPFEQWRTEHAIHHATTCDLNRRGTGDVWTMTVQEYLQASRWKRFAYRLARNPIVLFGIAPLVLLVVLERFPRAGGRGREIRSVWFTNVVVAAMAFGLGWLFGFLPYLLIQTTVFLVAGSIGIWLFYLQHQFEDTYWEHQARWQFRIAAVQGSSMYDLPRFLHWLTCHIGLHHLHHLSSRIPNYRLRECLERHPELQRVRRLSLRESLGCARLALWCEERRKLVSFKTALKKAA